VGRWFEIRSDAPSDAWPLPQEAVVREGAPYPLIRVAPLLGRALRAEFPQISRTWVGSGAYDGELLWLTAAEVSILSEEWSRFTRICRREEFIRGLDGRALFERLRESSLEPARLEEDLIEFGGWLSKAARLGYSLRLLI